MTTFVDAFSPMAFGQDDMFPPQETVSMADTTFSPAESCGDIKDEGDGKKPVKKRKSWGQELPVPKTNLPPRYAKPPVCLCFYTNVNNRKRAKTEDEKEQRRIERVLRNRQAAQSSRERKRQEVEKLEGEKSAIETQNDLLKERLMAVEHEKFKMQQQISQMAAELAALRRGSSSTRASLAPSPNFADDLLNNQRAIKQEIEDSIYGTAFRTPISLPSDSFSPTPSATTDSRSPSPSSLDLGFRHGLTTSPDMTQHPAAMLCDLQCQSGDSAAMVRPTIPARAQSPSQSPTTPNHSTLATQLFFLSLTSTVYSQLLLPLLQISHSLKMGSPLPTSLTIHPMSLRLIQWLILTPTDLTFSAAATATAPSTATPTSSRTTTRSKPTFRISLLRRLLLCSPALARPLLGATVRAMRAERGVALKERKARGRGVRTEKSWSRLMMLALAIECITRVLEKGRRLRKAKDYDLGRGKHQCKMALMKGA